MSLVSIQKFEEHLDLWRELYIIDDLLYSKIIADLRVHAVTPKIAYSHIIRFLGLWGVGQSAVGIDPRQLAKRINELRPKLAGLEPLLKLNLDKQAGLIEDMFKQLSAIKNIGPTSTSKILHLLKPETFVMWDAEIAKCYNVSMNEKGYVEFLGKMKNMLVELLEEYSRERGWSDAEARLTSKYGGKSLAKLIDEYNWLKTRKWLNRLKQLKA